MKRLNATKNALSYRTCSATRVAALVDLLLRGSGLSAYLYNNITTYPYLCRAFQGVPVHGDGVVSNLVDTAHQPHRVLGVCKLKEVILHNGPVAPSPSLAHMHTSRVESLIKVRINREATLIPIKQWLN